ncbi:MAG TPA: hypothetical protein VM580_01690, partial [Labilithrix sp.]|nr:hypothetical protein [Labilithrix sp.]
GQHGPAATALVSVLVAPTRRTPVDTTFIRLVESSLSGAGRTTERWVARELRAVAGDLAPTEHAELASRSANVGYAEGLSSSSLRSSVMPGALGRHPLWDAALICGSFAGKVARVGLTEQGASTRDRVKPRTTHPIRPVFDRVAKAFEVGEVELAVSDHVAAPAVACEDVPWLIVPSSLESFTDSQALAALARPMCRIALGVPWLGALGTHEVLALLVAFVRQVAPGFSAYPMERIEPLVQDYESSVRRAMDRKRRRMLEELEPALSEAQPVDEVAFFEAVSTTESRAALLLSGSLRASLDAMAMTDVVLAEALRVPGPTSLSAIFERAPARDLATYAFQSEATSLRRSLGTA